jgi:YHS domain-containing protein
MIGNRQTGTARNMLLIAALLATLSCNQQAQQTAAAKDTTTSAVHKPDLKGLTYAVQKDPACGMPLRAGLEDTVHYKGKLYGFCSKECKAAFLKDPDSYLAQLK